MSFIDYTDTEAIEKALVGHRIVAAEMNVGNPAYDDDRWYEPWQGPIGRLTLDDGTKVYVGGNEGGCACSAGDYTLTQLATVDNIITAVDVRDETTDETTDEHRYSLFVITEAETINVAQFEGDEGSGYYGSGFHLFVQGVQS